MCSLTARKGIAIPLTIVASIIVLGFVFSMTTLNQGLKTQVFQTNNHQLSFIMAFSAYSRLLAKVHTFSWAQRPFLSEPYMENKVAIQGGYYDLLAENTAGKDFQADIYIRTDLAGIKRLYFWRIKFNDDILDVSNRIIVEAFLNGDPNDFPNKNGPRPLAGKINNILAERKQNQKASDDLATEVSRLQNEKEILQKLAGKKPEDFKQNYPSDPADNMPENKTKVDFPTVPPITNAELPTNLDGNPSVGPDGFPDIKTGNSLSTEGLNKLSQEILSASERMNELHVEGWGYMGESREAADEVWAESDQKKGEAYRAMNNLVSEADALRDGQPSEEARIALEEMVSQSIAAGLGNMGAVLQRHLDHLLAYGDSVLNSITTSEHAELVVADWYNHVKNLKKDKENVDKTADSISNYAKDPSIEKKIQDTKDIAKRTLEEMEKYLNLARAKLNEMREKEAEERRRQEEEAENNAN